MEAHRRSDVHPMTRRSFLTAAGAAAGAALWPHGTLAVAAPQPGPQAFRFVHLADIHVKPESRGGDGFRQCVAAIHALKPRPDFILTGGDLVMDVLRAPEARAKELFDLYTRICKDSDIPFRHCVGNHDVFGWSNKSKIAPDHVSYGKKMVQDRLDLASTDYSFDHKGWHFCVLDDIQPLPTPNEHGYEAGLTGAQLDWLARDLTAAGKRPKVICAHIPIVSIAACRGVDATDKAQTAVPRASICRNPGPIMKTLKHHGVALALTGHLHVNEVLQFEQTTYVGEAAVSGAWWNGPHSGHAEGFGVFDCRADGTFEHQYHTYGWKAKG